MYLLRVKKLIAMNVEVVDCVNIVKVLAIL
jgi:hypothetical protein